MIKQSIFSAIIVVVKNDYKYLDRCLRSLILSAEQAKIKLDTVIIGNGIKIKRVKNWSSNISIINVDSNIGFGQAVNVGMDHAANQWCFIVCPDTKTDIDCLSRLQKYSQSSEIGLLLPRITLTDNSVQQTILPEPNLINIFYEQSYLFKVIPKINRMLGIKNAFYKPTEIKIGAAIWWMVNTKVFKQAEGFDKRFFLYFEDVDLCKRISKSNKILYVPDAVVTHNKHQSNKGIMFGDRYLNSLYLYLSKYHSIFYTNTCMSLVLSGTFLRLIYWNIKNVLSWKKKESIILPKIAYLKEIIASYYIINQKLGKQS